MKNQVIKVLNREHGKKVIEYWKSRGVYTNTHVGKITEEGGGIWIYYGVINGIFNNYSISTVLKSNAEIITLPGVEEEPTTGIKKDYGKLPYFTVLFKQFPNAIREIIKCSLAGHEKYKDTDKDWQNFCRIGNSDTRYKDACLRHMTESGIIEDMKPYGEVTHEAAVAWNALADLEIKLRG